MTTLPVQPALNLFPVWFNLGTDVGTPLLTQVTAFFRFTFVLQDPFHMSSVLITLWFGRHPHHNGRSLYEDLPPPSTITRTRSVRIPCKPQVRDCRLPEDVGGEKQWNHCALLENDHGSADMAHNLGLLVNLEPSHESLPNGLLMLRFVVLSMLSMLTTADGPLCDFATGFVLGRRGIVHSANEHLVSIAETSGQTGAPLFGSVDADSVRRTMRNFDAVVARDQQTAGGDRRDICLGSPMVRKSGNSPPDLQPVMNEPLTASCGHTGCILVEQPNS
eukprot:CAMPEP_0194522614 /NCGR_PEP_ID=MMETSP0253-20130528/57250_1 /TAXON_ID=2966 /ORGANISM="Noctiluca scintillans" /LENGTH=275 /DNA_ID=CAMNT_0039367069 /DNA_START=112 /DNA_END=941 /DNA_ORIENTATION=+